MSISKKTSGVFLLIAVVAIAVRIAVLMVIPPETAPWSDGAQYVNLGVSVAQGNGFQLEEGNYWHGQPAITRAPGMPLVLSLPLFLFPDLSPWSVARTVTVLFDVLNALLIVCLALKFGAGRLTACIAGCLYACNPLTAAMCAYPSCEPIGITFILLYLFVASFSVERIRILSVFFSGLMLSFACLVRPNWLLIGVLHVLAILWLYCKKKKTAVLAVVVFGLALILPLTPWLARNAILFGKFPIMGAGAGETFYGGNNNISAIVGGKYWGRLVMPFRLPGEPPLYELAARMNEYEVDKYYIHQGMKWVKSHPSDLPGLVLGKLYKAYIPIPRVKTAASLAGSLYRWLIYGCALVGMGLYWKGREKIPCISVAALLAVFMAHLVTVVLFVGDLRFVQAGEVLLVLPAALALKYICLRTCRRLRGIAL